MTPAEMIEQAILEGVVLAVTPVGTVSAKGDRQAIDRWAPVLRDNKAAILAELKLEQRRAGVLAKLQADPGIRYAIEIFEPDTDPVTVSLAIRAVGTCELTIPLARFDAFEVLSLVAKHSAIRSPTHKSTTASSDSVEPVAIALHQRSGTDRPG